MAARREPGRPAPRDASPSAPRDRRQAEPGRRPWGTPGRKGLWQAALLEASILSLCLLWTPVLSISTTKDFNVTIFMNPPEAIEGRSINFTPEFIPAARFFFARWYRGPEDKDNMVVTTYFPPLSGTTFGPAFSGRETTDIYGSLHIANLTLNDSGLYTVIMEGSSVLGIGFITIEVLEMLPNPVLWPRESLVLENTSVTLHCHTSSSPSITISWSQDGGPVRAEAQPSNQNRTLTLLELTRNDTGSYTCAASNHISNGTSNAVNITVAYGPGAAELNESGTVEHQLGSTLVLLCTAVDSVPKAEFQWLFNSTPMAEMNDTLRVRLGAWKDEGNYTCQAINRFTNGTASASAYVKLTEKQPRTLSVGTIVGIVIGSIAGVLLCIGIGFFLCTKAAACGLKKTYNIQH